MAEAPSLEWLQLWDMPWQHMHAARDAQALPERPLRLAQADAFRHQHQVAMQWDANLPDSWMTILAEPPALFTQRLSDIGVLCTVGYWGKDLGGAYFRSLVEQFGTAFLRGLLQRWQPMIGTSTTPAGALSIEIAGALALRAALLPRFSKTWTRIRLRLPAEVDRPNTWSPPAIASALEGWQLGWKSSILNAIHAPALVGTVPHSSTTGANP